MAIRSAPKPFFRPYPTGTVCGLVLWAAGCTLGPDYRRPDPPANAAYTEERVRLGNQRLKPGSDVPADWWRLFRSPKLQALITRALARSPDLEAAQAALTAARETLAAQESALLPALDAAGSVKRQKVSGALFGNPNFKGSVFTVYNGSLNVSYTFDVFGGIRRQLEAKDAEAEYQRFVLEGARLTLVSNLIATAIEEASLRKRQEITESIAFDQQQQLDILRDQQKLGGIADAAVLAQDADLSSTRAGLPPLQKQLDQARHRLAVLAGLPPGSHLAEQFRMEDLQLPEDLPLSVPAKLVAQRPDIRAQEALAHAASAEIGVATTKLFPDFTLTASVGTVATRAGDLFMPGSGIWNTGLNLLQPVFHGGQAIHGRRAAIANFAEADARYRSIVLQALQNVADVLKALEADGTELAARRNAADAAGASLKLVQTQYDAGATSFLALLDARRVDAQSRLALAQIEANRQTDTATLFQALGGGWWNRPDNTDHPSTKEPSP